MAVLKIKDYAAKGKYNYPSENIDPSLKKDKKWYLEQVKAMTHMYVTNQCSIPFSFTPEQVSITTLRLYATGRQGNKMVKRMLLKEIGNTGTFKTKMKNIFQTYDVLPEMFDVIRAMNQRQEYELTATCVDYDSIKEKGLEKAMMKHLIKAETQELMNRAQYKPNSQFSPEELAMMTEADVDMIFDSGGYILQKELAALACCEETKKASDIKGIEIKVNDDVIIIGKAGVKTQVNRLTKTITTRYVDIKHCMIPASFYPDYRDISRCGEYRKIQLSELLEINPNLTAEDIHDLCEGYSYMNFEAWTTYMENGQYENPNYLQYLEKYVFWVFDAQWLSADIKTKLITKHPNGNDIVNDVKLDYELNNQEKNKGAKLDQTKVIKKHQAIWLVGTDILLEYGQATDVNYYGKSGNKTPKLDYFFTQTGNMSLIERCMPHVDDINLNTVKLRNAVATLPPAPRMVIQQQLLDNVFLNGIKQKPEDLIQTLVERGYLVVNGVDDHGRPVYQNSKAIEFISTGLAEDVNLFNGLINDSINRIRQVLGLPEGLDGTAGNPYTGKGQTEMAAAASSDALFPTLSKVPDLFNRMYNDVVKKWQVYSKGKDLDVNWSPLGSTTREILRLGAEFPKADIDVEMKLSMNAQQKAMLIEQLNQMSQLYTSTNGQFGTSKSEYMMLYDMILSGRLKLAMFKIAQIEKRRETMNLIKEKRDQQFNIQSQQETAKLTAEESRKTVELENTEERKTAIVTEAQKRKTAATTAYMKTFDMEGMPMPQQVYEDIMKQANAEIASTFAPQGASEQMEPDQMSGPPEMMQQEAPMEVM